LALNHGIGILNSPGTIDSDYRGAIGIILINWGAEPFMIRGGDRIAQMVVTRVYMADVVEVEELDETPMRLSEKAIFPKLCVMLKKLSSEYQPYACGNFFRKP